MRLSTSILSSFARPLAVPFLMLIASASACGVSQDDASLRLPSDTDVSELTAADNTVERTIVPFTLLSADIGSAGQTETRRVFTSDADYRAYFGQPAPAEVNFASDWVFFYSAGGRPTGGYSANLSSITRAGADVNILTSLTSPGTSCVSTQATTKPYVLAKLGRLGGPTSVHYFRADRVRDCRLENPCAAVLCPTGHRCVAQEVQCIKEPCDPQPSCVPIEKEVTCGGFAGRACPGAGVCNDDPRDTCDPRTGGRDCSGVCACPAVALCKTGHWDGSPAVCSCVP